MARCKRQQRGGLDAEGEGDHEPFLQGGSPLHGGSVGKSPASDVGA